MASGLSTAQGRLLSRAISSLVLKCEAQGAVLCDDVGNVLAHAAMPHGELVQTVAALGAGSFAATRELACMIGEPGFESIYHQGSRANVYVRSIAANFFLLVVFRQKTTAGLVKLYVERMSEEVLPTLQEVARQTCAAAGGARTAFELDPAAQVFATARTT